METDCQQSSLHVWSELSTKATSEEPTDFEGRTDLLGMPVFNQSNFVIVLRSYRLQIGESTPVLLHYHHHKAHATPPYHVTLKTLFVGSHTIRMREHGVCGH
jgi:hypothetical protein